MSDDDVGEAAHLVRMVRHDHSPIQTPEQIARDKWADDVQAKIASCERDQWMPLVMASEIRKLRIQLIAFSLLPPILILAGLGMMTRARRISTKTAGKLITAFGVLIGAVIISAFATRISDQFDTIVFMYLHEPPRDSIWYPVTLHDLRLDAIFATLIPAGIVLWWRQPDTASKPVLACCLGIAAGFVPVMIQIISWPFVYRSDGVRATAVVATIGAASLSVMATTRILKGDTQAKQNTFVHTQRGLRRLYIALLIPWVAWFGYAASESNGSIRFLQSQLDQFTHYYLSWLQDFKNDESDARRNMAAKELEKLRIVWDVRTNDELDKSISASIEESRDRLTNDVYALLAGVMPFLLYPMALWVIAGFRKPAQENEAKTPTSAAPPTSAPPVSVTDYQSAIDRAVSELADNTPETRQALYERARAALASQLSGQDLPNSHITRQMRLLNAAMRSAENYARSAENDASLSSRLARRGSTTLLVLSILYGGLLWVTDVTCMSIYWVARLPKDLWEDANRSLWQPPSQWRTPWR